MAATEPEGMRQEEQRIEENVEGQIKAEIGQEPAAQTESWAEIARRLEERIRGEMANLIGLGREANWEEVGRGIERRTKVAFGGWAGATAEDDWDAVGRKIEARTRERAARWSGVQPAEQANWDAIGRQVESRARTGLGSWAGAAPDADWRTVATAYRTRISAELRDRFGTRPAPGGPAQEGETAMGEQPAAGKGRWEEFRVTGSELLGKVKQLVHEGNIRRVIIKQDDRVIVEFPLTVGVVGALLAPMLVAVGAIAALVAECTIVVERSA